jgi:hypothetical protein
MMMDVAVEDPLYGDGISKVPCLVSVRNPNGFGSRCASTLKRRPCKVTDIGKRTPFRQIHPAFHSVACSHYLPCKGSPLPRPELPERTALRAQDAQILELARPRYPGKGGKRDIWRGPPQLYGGPAGSSGLRGSAEETAISGPTLCYPVADSNVSCNPVHERDDCSTK